MLRIAKQVFAMWAEKREFVKTWQPDNSPRTWDRYQGVQEKRRAALFLVET